MKTSGRVYLIGMGPGDPGLVTVKALRLIKKAHVVVYDRLVDPSLLRFADEKAEMYYVGKESSRHAVPQDGINRLLVEKAKEGRIVARLKGGDPFVFGRGGEEAEELLAAGIPFEVVPGISSSMAVPAYAGIPVTHRSHTSSFAVITGHEEPGKETSSIDWEKISTGAGTLVFLMGVGNLPQIVEKLVENGRPPDTPAAVIQWGTRPGQRTATGTLATIVERVRAEGLGAPSVIVVGEVVSLREKLAWFDTLPLFGKNIVVTRARRQASAMCERLRDLGANPLELPTIRIDPPADAAPLNDAIECIRSFDWIVFSSPNGVEALFERLLASGRDVRALGAASICAIGPGTAAKLAEYRIKADLVPEKFIAESVLEALIARGVKNTRILLPRAAAARDVLPEGLAAEGASVHVVEAYRTVAESPEKDEIEELFRKGRIDAVTFTSSSTVHNFFEIMGARSAEWLARTAVACIGPVTAETAAEKGIAVAVTAEKYTIDGLVDALVTHFSR